MTEEEKHRFAILLEQIAEQIQILSEGVCGMNNRMDRFETKMDNLEEKATRLETKLDFLEVKTNQLETVVLEIQKDTSQVPMVKNLFQNHEKRIGILEKA